MNKKENKISILQIVLKNLIFFVIRSFVVVVFVANMYKYLLILNSKNIFAHIYMYLY